MTPSESKKLNLIFALFILLILVVIYHFQAELQFLKLQNVNLTCIANGQGRIEESAARHLFDASKWNCVKEEKPE